MIYLFTTTAHYTYHYFYNTEDAGLYCVVTRYDDIAYWSSDIDGWLQLKHFPFQYELPRKLLYVEDRAKVKKVMFNKRITQIIFDNI